MLSIKKIILFFTFFWIVIPNYAQTPVFKNYTVDDGLPSSEVYSAFQDSKGYMWFATDAGVSRFNGYEFENFDVSDGLTDNTVFFITEDNKGRIWFGTFNCRISYYYNDSIYPYKYNEKISEVLQGKSVMQELHVDNDGSVWVSFNDIGIIKCDTNGSIIVTPKEKPDIGMDRLDVLNIEGSLVYGIFIANLTRIAIIEEKDLTRNFLINIRSIFEKDVTTVLSFDVVHKIKQSRNTLIGKMGKDLIIHFSRTNIFHFSYQDSLVIKRLKMPDFQTNVNTIFDDDGFIWFCTGKGIFKMKIVEDELIIVDHLLQEEPVSRIYKDKEKGYWVLSLKSGIFYLSKDNIRNTSFRDAEPTSIEVDTVNNYFYLAFNNGKLLKKIANTDYKMEYEFEKVYTSYNQRSIRSLTYNYFNNNLYVLGGSKGYDYYKNGKIVEKEFSHWNTDHKSMISDSNIIYICNNYGMSIIKDDIEGYFSYIQGEPKIWCTSVLKDKDKIWIGTNDGVRIYQNGKISSPFGGNKYFSSAITSLERLNEEIILVGTKSYGVLVVENDSIVDILDEKRGLPANLVRKIYIEKNNVWVGTNKGLSRVNFKNEGGYEIYNLNQKHGLKSAEITDITSYKDILYMLTPKELVALDKSQLKMNENPPPIYITTFEVNSTKRGFNQNSVFPYDENSVNLSFEGLNYSSLGKVEYKYRMLGVDTTWTTTFNRKVQYPTLQPNDYVFEVKARNEDGIWSNQPAKVSFTINPPFWKTWWFILLEVLLGILIVGGIFKYREKQLLEKGEVEKKIIELELKALRAQMNPHFIFNTLNSIQHYIALKDFKETNRYLTKFAQLIRTVLNLSEKSLISIREEIDMLQLYLDLERMRFDDQFEYEIKVNPDIDIDYDKIPSMLIQPYIENAVWHGLMNKKEKGKIEIDMKLVGEVLECTITDNGIGRKDAAKIKEKRRIKQKSVGMTITKERLDIINNQSVEVKIIDLVDKNIAKGTQVIIRIPL